jgi:hypothetical protein
MLTLESRIAPSPGAAGEAGSDGYFLLDLETGSYFRLDRVGRFIWKQLEGGGALTRTVTAVVAGFDVEPERAERDVLDLVSELATAGLVRVIDAE